MTILEVITAGPAMTVQDIGRSGFHANGLTKGGAADPLALAEGAALLGQPATLAALEMTGMGGRFRAPQDLRIALTGATMRATLDGEVLAWNTSHRLPRGGVLTIGGATQGVFGYLHVGGGIDTPVVMGARATHAPAGIGTPVTSASTLPIGHDHGTAVLQTLVPEPRLAGGTLRFVASMQTDKFTEQSLCRFQNTGFTRDPRGNRQGIRMAHQGDGFFADGQLNIVSEVIVAGDIQIAGDGAPYVLGPDCQTTGGYPRIGTVIPCDLPRVNQAQPATPFRFQLVTLAEAVALELKARAAQHGLPGRIVPLIRDPAGVKDLLSMQLVSGAICARANPYEEP